MHLAQELIHRKSSVQLISICSSHASMNKTCECSGSDARLRRHDDLLPSNAEESQGKLTSRPRHAAPKLAPAPLSLSNLAVGVGLVGALADRRATVLECGATASRRNWSAAAIHWWSALALADETGP
jgi:hypothetical protein